MFDSIFNQKGLSLERLRRFCEVARAGSIIQAQEQNRREQSSYSRDIAALEAYFGFPLFGRASGHQRSGRRMAGLTSQGRALLPLATDILRRLDEYRDFSDTPRRIRIGGGETAMHWIVGAHMAAIVAGFPGTTVEVCNCATQEETLTALQEGRLDFAIVDESVVADAPFRQRAQTLGTLSYALYIHKETLEQTQRRTRNRLLSQIPWVALRDASRMTTDTIAELERLSISVNLAATLTTFRQAATVLKGRTLAGLFPTLAEKDMTELGFQKMDHPALQGVRVPISLLYNEDQEAQHPYLQAAAETLGRIMVPLDDKG